MKIPHPIKERRERKEEKRRKREEAERKKKKRSLTITRVILAIVFVICGIGALTENSSPTTVPENSSQVETVADATPTESLTGTEPSSTEDIEPTDTQAPAFDLSSVPGYSGSPYVAINGNVPYFTDSDLTTSSFETYSNLDSLGRCGVAYANIGTDLMPTEERGTIGQIKPSGWHTVKYNDVIDGNYLYNRCHLIGYQLTGENDNTKNLITGTRYLNVQGMLPFENMVADYINETNNHVLYRVTPIFEGDNLVASGVLMEAMSVEDSGDGILFNVFCYNVQPHIEIDYATGNSRQIDGETEVPTEPATQAPTVTQQPETTQPPASTVTYILNTNTKKFQYPSYSSVNDMSEKNKREFSGTRDEAIAMGYDPCGRCHP